MSGPAVRLTRTSSHDAGRPGRVGRAAGGGVEPHGVADDRLGRQAGHLQAADLGRVAAEVAVAPVLR